MFFLIGYGPFVVHIMMANGYEVCLLWGHLQWPWWAMGKPGANEAEMGHGCQLGFY